MFYLKKEKFNVPTLTKQRQNRKHRNAIKVWVHTSVYIDIISSLKGDAQ